MIEKIREKTDNFMNNLFIFGLLLFSYIYVPSIVASLIFHFTPLNEEFCSIIGNIVYVIILLIIYNKMFKEKIKDYKENFSDYFGISLKYWGIGFLVLIISNLILNTFIFNGNIATNETEVRSFISSNLVIGFISVVFLAPLVEEMIFRFGIRKVTGKTKFFPLISALCFGLPHALTGITSPLELLYVIPYGALGYAFGCIYNKTDNILCSTSMHMLHNLVSFLAILSVM